MSHITLSEEQVRILREAPGPVEVRDLEGRVLGAFHRTPTREGPPVEVRDHDGRLLGWFEAPDPALAETVAECKRRLAAAGPRVPSSQVKAFLRKCSEIDQAEGMTQARMDDLVRRAIAGEPL